MEPFRNTLVRLINDARNNPSAAGQRLYDELEKHYKEEELHYFDKHIETFEGIAALEDYRRCTLRTKPVRSLAVSEVLCKAAQSIAEEKGRSGRCDHESPKAIYERISGSAQVEGRIGELIAFKTSSSEETAAYFLIDDGLATRKRRRMLLDEGYGFIGVGTAYHRTHDIITVILLAGQVSELRESQAASYSRRVRTEHEEYHG